MDEPEDPRRQFCHPDSSGLLRHKEVTAESSLRIICHCASFTDGKTEARARAGILGNSIAKPCFLSPDLQGKSSSQFPLLLSLHSDLGDGFPGGLGSPPLCHGGCRSGWKSLGKALAVILQPCLDPGGCSPSWMAEAERGFCLP